MKNKLYHITNLVYYLYKRNNWIFDSSRHFKNFKNIQIDRPIFLLGTQGGGLTLISRMLRKNKKIVSITGNYKYWSGADEMQNVLGSILPPELTGIKHKAPADEKFSTPRGWLYATDQLINKYRSTSTDISPALERKLKKIIKWSIYRHAPVKDKARFIDKSQLYTIKISFLNKLLEGTSPKFILITRNPYAICYRSVKKAYSLRKLKNQFTFSERLKFASQHWANSMKYALMDGNKTENFTIFKFEDILKNPESKMKKLCNFAELDFNKSILPQPEDKIPFGSKRQERWYPIKPEINKKYLNEITREYIDIIDEYCSSFAKKLGYKKPNKPYE